MSTCKILKNGFHMDPRGEIDYCCENTVDGSNRPMFEDPNEFFAYRKPLYERSKKEWIKGCSGCRHSEMIKNRSLRTVGNSKLHMVPDDDYEIHYAIINTGNICNLACRMCTTGSSTKWISYNKRAPEQRKIWDDNMGHEYEFMDDAQTRKYDDDRMRVLKEHVLTPSLKFMSFGGGEPTDNPRNLEILRYCLEKDIAKNIFLNVHTNGTHSLRGTWTDVLKEFKYVHMVFSIDGTFDNYNYIRQDSNWDTVIENMQYVKSVLVNEGRLKFIGAPDDDVDNVNTASLTASSCIQALNAHRFHHDKQFWMNNIIHHHNWQAIHSPDYMGLHVIHPELRERFDIVDICEGIEYNETKARKFFATNRWMDQTFGRLGDLPMQVPHMFDETLYPFANSIYHGEEDYIIG
tara:strand:- start:3963 stop:5177 length:1215 start_codon:yes stop_codon:yes gene_type:complete